MVIPLSQWFPTGVPSRGASLLGVPPFLHFNLGLADSLSMDATKNEITQLGCLEIKKG